MTESDWCEVLKLISEIEEKAQRSEDRGLEHATGPDIVQAQMALGCKRGMAELRRLIQTYREIQKRIENQKQEAIDHRSRKGLPRASAGIHPLTATGSSGD